MSEPKRTPKERAAQFVGALQRLRADRGKLAALRRCLTDNSRLQVDAWPVIASLGGDISQPACVAIAGLFAAHPEVSEARNFGETCRRIAQDGGGDVADSFDRRFRRLLASDSTDDLIGQLRSWIRLAAGKGVGVNYESLFADLWNWEWYAEDVRVKWARSFWQAGEGAVAEARTSKPTLV